MATTYAQREGNLNETSARDGMVAVRHHGISWNAVFAGTAVGLVFQLWMAMLGTSIGASTVDPLRGQTPMVGLAIGSVIWLAVTVISASFIGGWVTGVVSGTANRFENALHGLVAWGTSNIITFLLLGTVIGGAMGGISKVAQNSQMNGISMTSEMGDRAQNVTESEARRAGDVAAKATTATTGVFVFLMLLGLVSGIGGAVMASGRVRGSIRR